MAMCPAREIISLPSIGPTQFKAAMRRIANTVTVITSRSGVAMNGMTATAVCSVSAEPPCILVVINQTNRSHALIERTGTFVVNVLSDDQEYLAQHFALKSDDPFAEVEYRYGMTGVPLLPGCVASLECVVESQTRSGTHSIFVGRVVNTDKDDGSPLLHTDGAFVKLERHRPA
ncbi:MAG: flavin reductase [Bradyrhizobiaceae bacterium]|nr:MAG: flavin reductase [Bradyrhizobiaceae bacterium]